ncbi:ABC transporter ATP-binding protein/permease [Chloroflexi bacterium TSY]|nr:ABC transporter ATP-binding protein/permease [Chloroflexi bacterium TSY]
MKFKHKESKIQLNPYVNLLLTYLKPHWKQAGLLFLLLLIVIGLQLYSPLILSRFIDAAVEGEPLHVLLRIAAVFLGLAIAIQITSVIETYVAENLGMMATNQLRADVALHCLQLDMSFHISRTPGELIERIDGDVTALGNFFSRFVVLLVGNALLVIGILMTLTRIDLWLAGMLTVMTIVGLLIIMRIRDVAVPSITAVRQAMTNLLSFLEERLGGIDDLHANGATEFSVEQLREHGYTHLQMARKMNVILVFTVSASRLFFTVVTAITLVFIVNLYTNQIITLGTAYLIYRYTDMLMRPVEEISRQMQDFQKAIASVVRVRELVETESKIVDTGRKKLPLHNRVSAGVKTEFANVSFSYTLGKPVLHDISFSLEPGEVLGILGHTGSGKTTLTRLLFRLYEPTVGTIRLNNENLPELTLPDLRRQIGLVTQDVQLFDATVRDNLTFFDHSIDDERIMTTLNEVGLASWVETLPSGLDTKLDYHHSHLSAGEAQLLAFTRVFLSNPALIVLDEASSRLDPITEQHIERALDRLLMNRTAIVIAHRLATVQRVDTIMIMENGRIVEYGPREELATSPTTKFAHLLQVGLEDSIRHSFLAYSSQYDQ